MVGKVTEEMILFSRSLQWYRKEPRTQRERDRTLAGKKRRKARKAARQA